MSKRNSFRKLRRSQNEAARIATHLKSPTLMLIVSLATIGALAYAIFLFQPGNRGDMLPYILVVLAESFILLQAIIALWTILASGRDDPRSYEFHHTQSALFSPTGRITLATLQQKEKVIARVQKMSIAHREISVDVFVTVLGEDPAVIRDTVTAARDMIGKHQTYILDDGGSDVIRLLATELGVEYIRRSDRSGAKAGNINNALSLTNGEFFVVFDADFVPDATFLYETLPFFENTKVAFVQTPQHYDNLDTLISRGAGFMQHVFYALIQPGKNRFNSAFCVGTNVVFRRSAIEQIGGIYQQSKSEDIWTSLVLHELGYQSIYIPNVLAIGKTPETIKTYSKQQLRWATGGFEILLKHNPLFRHGLTIDQRIQYFGTTTYYLQGLAALMLLVLPPLQIYFNLTPVNLGVSVGAWAVFYGGFYGLQILLAFYTMGGFRWEALVLSTVSAPIYVRALWNAMFGRDQAWQSTGAVQKIDSPFNYIVPQVMIAIFLFITSGIGLWKFWYTDQASLSIVWNTINAMVFGSFFVIALREAGRLKREARAAHRLVTERVTVS